MDSSKPDFSLVTTIQLPGSVGGHGDWVAYDAATQTIWLAQSPDNNVVVIDARTNTVKATISGIDNANGIALSPRYAFVADPVNNVVDVIDKRTFQIVDKVAATGTTLDGVTYDPQTHQVYVASDDNNVLDAISARPGFAQTGSYALTPSSSGPDVPTYAKGVVYVPDGTKVDAVDPSSGQVLASPTLVTTGAVKPGVYDPVTDQFLFGTTTGQIEVVSGGTGPGGIGSVVSSISIAGSTDQAAIDVHARLAFFGNKAGEVDVVSLNTMKVVATLPAETGMHTLNVDPRTHELYVYENNRNVVDVWRYGNDGSMTRADGPWVHVGSGGMGFSGGGSGGGTDGGSGGGGGSLADALRSGDGGGTLRSDLRALFGGGGGSSGSMSSQDPSSGATGWIASDQSGNHGVLASILAQFGQHG
jgi:YVTN family beta-propeller protein